MDTDTVCQACLGIVEYDSTEVIDTLPYCGECIDNWCRVCMPDDPRGSPETCEHRPREEDEEPQEPRERLAPVFVTPRRSGCRTGARCPRPGRARAVRYPVRPVGQSDGG